MNIIIGLGHPAHYHLFKNTKKQLEEKQHNVLFVITPKDVLQALLDENNEIYEMLYKNNRKSMVSKSQKIIKSTINLGRIIKKQKSDLLIGCLPQLVFAGRLTGVPSVFVGEDDFAATWIQGVITYPFAKHILSPNLTNLGPFKKKKTPYSGYQKLAYLHPNHFSKQANGLENLQMMIKENYFLVRFSALSAYHDLGVNGISLKNKRQLINLLLQHGHVYISAENNDIENEFLKYRLNVPANKIHSVMAHATLFVGDSQSMASEAALLGIPSLRCNTFAGRISYLEEQEKKYKLTYAFHPKNFDKLLHKAKELLSIPNLKEEWQARREKMLEDKIDVTAFMVWFIEKYPKSAKIMKENPDYQYRFK